MTAATWFMLAILLFFAVLWRVLTRGANPRAKLGPDGTNVREPETFVVHHEGKGQSLDISNTALRERTETPSRDLPGPAHQVKAAIPGRDPIRMNEPPSDVSRYGSDKVAPEATPGVPGAESMREVLTKGPRGSRPETPEEPGTPYAKGRRVTDNYRDVELAEEMLANPFPGSEHKMDRDMAASPSTNGQEPGYGPGRTSPDEGDGEGGDGDGDHANNPYGHEQTELTDTLTDLSEGEMMKRHRATGQEAGQDLVADSRGRPEQPRFFLPDEALPPVAFLPDADWESRAGADQRAPTDWAALHQPVPLPNFYGEDVVVALVRNPRSLYVYWERGGYGDENLRSMLGDFWNSTSPCLRVFDVTAGAHPGQPGGRSFVIRVDEHDDHWFVNDSIEPGHRYVVSYERMTPDGQLYLISHSAPVETPHEGPAQETPFHQQFGRQPGSWSGNAWR